MKRDEIASPLSTEATKIMLLGAGELGKEVIIEAKRLGFYTIAVDRYHGAPGQQVADKAYTGDMRNAGFLRSIVEREKPDAIVPEIEAINLDLLFELEKEGYNVIPNARASHAAMQRERIRKVIAEEAGVETSKYAYASTLDELKETCEKIGYPCWVKAIMDSSGHGSSFVKGPEDVEKAFDRAKNRARGSADKLIIEEHIDFDIEITELAVRHLDENGNTITSFPKPVGHYQIDGDYHSSWQPAEVSESIERKIYEAAGKITGALGGLGLFGCELFVKGDKVYGNECSPRPHDTGMVTFVSHQMGFSECGLQARAITGLPIPTIKENGISHIEMMKPAASHVIISPSEGWVPKVGKLWNGINTPGVSFLCFGKPEAHVGRRMGVALATADTVEEAKKKAETAAHGIEIATATAKEWKGQVDREKHLLH